MLHPSTSQTGEDNKLINESGYHDIGVIADKRTMMSIYY